MKTAFIIFLLSLSAFAQETEIQTKDLTCGLGRNNQYGLNLALRPGTIRSTLVHTIAFRPMGQQACYTLVSDLYYRFGANLIIQYQLDVLRSSRVESMVLGTTNHCTGSPRADRYCYTTNVRGQVRIDSVTETLSIDLQGLSLGSQKKSEQQIKL